MRCRRLHTHAPGGCRSRRGASSVPSAQPDQRATLVAGALSSDPAKAKEGAPDFAIAPARAYGSYQELLDGEARLPAEEILATA